MSALLLVSSLSLSGAPPLQADTLQANRTALELLAEYSSMFLDAEHPDVDSRCSADAGDNCFGDPDLRPCYPTSFDCTPRMQRDRLLADLVELADRAPESGFIVSQAFYLAVKAGKTVTALQLLEGCEAAAWLCKAMEAFLVHSTGQVVRSETLFREALAVAPDSIRAALTDPTALTQSWNSQNLLWRTPDHWPGRWRSDAGLSAEQAEQLWWWSDPFYVIEGNDRWSEHVYRSFVAWLREAAYIRSSYVDTYGDYRWLLVTRRGWPDSWSRVRTSTSLRRGGRQYYYFTGRDAARYHFVPELDADVGTPVWRIDAELDDEGYTPPYGSIEVLDAQRARFRRDSSMVVVTAVSGSPAIADADDSEVFLFATDRPGEFTLTLQSVFRERTAVFMTETPDLGMVHSVEAVAGGRLGRSRA